MMNKSTKHYAPFTLECYLAVKTEKKAKEMELYFKGGSGKAFLIKTHFGEKVKLTVLLL